MATRADPCRPEVRAMRDLLVDALVAEALLIPTPPPAKPAPAPAPQAANDTDHAGAA